MSQGTCNYDVGDRYSRSISEVVTAAIWGVETLQIEIAAALAGVFAIAFDFAAFAFVTKKGIRKIALSSVGNGEWGIYHAMEM